MNCEATTAANSPEQALIESAMAGDQAALERLLLAHYDDLERRIRGKLPPKLQSVQAVEDILQLTFIQAFRDISRFDNVQFDGRWHIQGGGTVPFSSPICTTTTFPRVARGILNPPPLGWSA